MMEYKCDKCARCCTLTIDDDVFSNPHTCPFGIREYNNGDMDRSKWKKSSYVLWLFDGKGNICDKGFFDAKEEAVRSGEYQIKNYPELYARYEVKQ